MKKNLGRIFCVFGLLAFTKSVWAERTNVLAPPAASVEALDVPVDGKFKNVHFSKTGSNSGSAKAKKRQTDKSESVNTSASSDLVLEVPQVKMSVFEIANPNTPSQSAITFGISLAETRLSDSSSILQGATDFRPSTLPEIHISYDRLIGLNSGAASEKDSSSDSSLQPGWHLGVTASYLKLTRSASSGFWGASSSQTQDLNILGLGAVVKKYFSIRSFGEKTNPFLSGGVMESFAQSPRSAFDDGRSQNVFLVLGKIGTEFKFQPVSVAFGYSLSQSVANSDFRSEGLFLDFLKELR